MAENITQSDPSQRRLAAENFLASVEQRAFHMVMLATRQREDAMDIMQDAMLAWVSHYLGRSQDDWKPLFYKVLQNKIRDWQRRTMVRRRILRWFGGEDNGEETFDTSAVLADIAADPVNTLTHRQALENALHVLERLPLRQQQAFLLRSWEGLNVAETALAMGCSEGSVKTHLSRAMNSLRAALGVNDE